MSHDLNRILGFEWDEWNLDKSYKKHGITQKEAEEVFLDLNLQVESDIEHSGKEERFIAIGRIVESKILFTVFTIRKAKIRVISARIANKKERNKYDTDYSRFPIYRSKKQETRNKKHFFYLASCLLPLHPPFN